MNIYITLDYELFMGAKTGTPMNCLIRPMKALCSIAEKHNVKFNVFVDAAYLLRLKNIVGGGDYQLVSKHIRYLEEQGHDVELHFHPQWLYSEYKDGHWDMNLEIYKISEMQEGHILQKFKEAKELLDSLIGRRTIAFRAGGYSLNSYPKYIQLFRDNDLFIDSSVLGRNKVDSQFQSYDYSTSPMKCSWRFSSDVCIEDPKGSFYEYPISTSPKISGFKYYLHKRRLSRQFGNNCIFGDGFGIGLYQNKLSRFLSLFRSLLIGKSIPASIDGILSQDLTHIYNLCRKESRSNMVIIGHPKNASEKSLKQLDDFLALVASNDTVTTFKSKFNA